jgi:predicted RNA binding protein YcfA (HicA-like mRNA interferase family)
MVIMKFYIAILMIDALQKIGFQIVKQKGSHVRLKHNDNRVVTIPVHGNKCLGKGLLRKILRDVELTVEQFQEIL